MNTFRGLFRFELAYYGRRLSTHIYFLLFVALAFLLMSALGGAFPDVGISVGNSDGNVHINSPYILGLLTTALSLFAIMVTAAIAGDAGCRDFAVGIHSLFFTAPIRKWQYWWARLAATLPVNLYIYSGIGVGLWLATLMPWMEPERVGPNNLLFYLMPYLVLAGPNLLLAATLFFSLAATTRKMLPNYLGGVLLVLGYLLSQTFLSQLESQTAAALLDPFGMGAVAQLTRYWTTFEKNTQSIPLSGLLLQNRLLWMAVGAGVAAVAYLLFDFSYGGREWSRRAARRAPRPDGADGAAATAGPAASSKQGGVLAAVQVPTPIAETESKRLWRQYFTLTRRGIADVLGNVYFYAILTAGMLFLGLTAPQVGRMYGTPTWPVTYLVLSVLGGSFSLFVLIVLTFYAGELVWHERDVRVQQINDTMPVPNWVPYCAKFTALTIVITLLLGVILVAGVATQLLSGYHHLELGLYLKILFGINWIDYLLLCVLALMVQVVAGNKYTGHFIMVLYYGLLMFRGSLGLEHNLYVFGSDPGMTYSDMNGFGPFLAPYLWFKLYWAAAALGLAVISNLFWNRGQEMSFGVRCRLARQRLQGPVAILGTLALLLFAGVGGFIFYNTNILNEYRTSRQEEELAAQYERRYKQYENLPQPRIVSSSVRVEIYPRRGDLEVSGVLGLKNRSGVPLPQVHLRIPVDLEVKKLDLGAGATQELVDDEVGYRIFALDPPLQPGGELELDFDLVYATRGFENQTTRTMVVENGSFIHSSAVIPAIGYSADAELSSDQTRKKHGLEPKARMAKLEDPAARNNNYLTNDSDWIDFDAVVGTDLDQIAMAPGYLQREWTEGDRHYFHYVMDRPILNFYSFLSARYAVEEDEWHGLPIQVLYDPAHPYNVARMIDAAKQALDYYSAAFSPYQHRQLRILEFPRYATFAQSFPNTIPFSEGIGFIARVGENDIDYPFYVTAHEVAHQWWAHQVIGANCQGATMLSETLAQYSALMVMEQEFGPEKMRRFLKYELHRYLMGRSTEKKRELPLMRAENQAYIHYHKGALAMYALRDYLGEATLNRALSDYLYRVRYQEPPYTTSEELVEAIAAVTPPDLQYLIDDLFRTITLYENRALKASYEPLEDGRYRVTLELEAKKLRCDGEGREKEVPLREMIDVGVFAGAEEADERVLYLDKRPITGGAPQTVTIIVDEKPTAAGIDPYNKLIDRHPDDNRVTVDHADGG